MVPRLRFAQLDDLDAVMALEEAGFPPGIVETREVFSQRIRAFPRGFLLAADGDGVPWGYLCCEVWSGYRLDQPERFDLGHDIGAWLEPAGDTLYIASMTVAPGFRGGGRGRGLFREGVQVLAQEFPSLRQAVLIVNEHWTEARRIYRTEGFEEVGRLPGFFRPLQGPQGDALVMVASPLPRPV